MAGSGHRPAITCGCSGEMDFPTEAGQANECARAEDFGIIRMGQKSEGDLFGIGFHRGHYINGVEPAGCGI